MGQNKRQKNAILQFNGFEFDKDDSEAKQKIIEDLEKRSGTWTTALVRSVCDLLDIDRSGCSKKEDILDRMIQWIMSPHAKNKVCTLLYACVLYIIY